ncbi:MAG: hypothetical protein IKI45_00050 [Oscillospiraceae bacterium]|nr:hypothetical protein [Oscillospiraceae bacterium]
MEFTELTDRQRRQILGAIAGTFFHPDSMYVGNTLDLLSALYDPETGYALTQHYYVGPIVTKDAAEEGFLLLHDGCVRMLARADCPDALRQMIEIYQTRSRERNAFDSDLLSRYALTDANGEPVRTGAGYLAWFLQSYTPVPDERMAEPVKRPEISAPDAEPDMITAEQPDDALHLLLERQRSGRLPVKPLALTVSLVLILAGLLMMLTAFLLQSGNIIN